jgi:hypothetical protein
LSGKGSFLKFLFKYETISAEISAVVDKNVLSGGNDFINATLAVVCPSFIYMEKSFLLYL